MDRLLPFLSAALLLYPGRPFADTTPVRYPQGSLHGYLIVRTLEGELLATGESNQVVHGHIVTSRLVFRFKDGSMDEETTLFSQASTLRLLKDHHIQKGPSFPHPMDLLIDAEANRVTSRTEDDGREKTQVVKMDVPPDVANGMLIPILSNIRRETTEAKVSYIGGTKPRLVHLTMTRGGDEVFNIADESHKAAVFTIKAEIGGIVGAVAPLIGKQPPDNHVWMTAEGVSTFLKARQTFFEGGPLWDIEQRAPDWPRSAERP